ncbi:UDP-glucose 4-epimerase family protein [Pseudomonas abietaniphila]|uniref:Nucleoside-diphosphate-sugar epimerase n=1 Tax=Pseudomonas abietaniphila TaxID=89065 RepID=A0A1G8BPY8_9PSED|nr:SDR family oxidoreductase [Pseudomonas abietaniphila]SDH35203.1 Nucleoside-diphosphate-sugar epimerase [Pseudomonas abietaniphila]
MVRKILVTGSSGFLGRALVENAAYLPGTNIFAASRQVGLQLPTGVKNIPVGNLATDTAWQSALRDMDVVIHTAARVHVMNDTAADPLALFREVNTAGTLNLARQAAAAGVRRFIFISSIKVNGESTARDEVFRPDDVARPSDPYAISKYEAELGLLELAKTCAMEVVIIRPVLVYGPGVKANFLQLMRALRKGIPLPLGAIRNARSLVSLDNLVDFIRVCVDHPAAANQIFLVSDGEDFSTTELAKRLKAFMPLSGWLVPVPQSIIQLGARLLGRKAAAQRVLGSLRVDISKNRDLLGWTPPVSVDEALKKTVDHFLATEQK